MTPAPIRQRLFFSAIFGFSLVHGALVSAQDLESIADKIRVNRLRSDAIREFPKGDGIAWIRDFLVSKGTIDTPPPQNILAGLNDSVGFIVSLKKGSPEWVGFQQGTCFVVDYSDQKAIVVTCAHLLPVPLDIQGVLIGVVNTKGEIGIARRCLLLDIQADIVVFETDPIFSSKISYPSKSPAVGAVIRVIGHHPKIGMVRLSGSAITESKDGFLYSDVRAVGGFSGSPCFSENGRLFGWVQEIVPSLRAATVSGTDLFCEGSFTKIRLLHGSELNP